jgi:hypothetical protein
MSIGTYNGFTTEDSFSPQEVFMLVGALIAGSEGEDDEFNIDNHTLFRDWALQTRVNGVLLDLILQGTVLPYIKDGQVAIRLAQ